MSAAQAPAKRPSWHRAYDAQMALWRWYRTDRGQRFMLDHLRDSGFGLNPGTQEMLSHLYAAELGRLLDCDPLYVSAEMCEVVDAAKETFAPEPLLETDIVTTRGFLFFERPFDVPDRFGVPTNIAAVSWVRMIAHGDPEEVKRIQGKLEEIGPVKDARVLEDEAIDSGARPSGLAITLYQDASNLDVGLSVIPLHVTPWFFGMTFDGNEVDENGVPTGAGWWWRIVQTTFRLMQQRISVRHFHRPDRDSRRTAAKLKFPDDTEVVVVRLRREDSERHDPTGELANYSHRFIVSGHWRQQWYPSINGHRQIWVSPYVKGPEDKPLIVRPKRVFQWSR